MVTASRSVVMHTLFSRLWREGNGGLALLRPGLGLKQRIISNQGRNFSVQARKAVQIGPYLENCGGSSEIKLSFMFQGCLRN